MTRTVISEQLMGHVRQAIEKTLIPKFLDMGFQRHPSKQCHFGDEVKGCSSVLWDFIRKTDTKLQLITVDLETVRYIVNVSLVNFPLDDEQLAFPNGMEPDVTANSVELIEYKAILFAGYSLFPYSGGSRLFEINWCAKTLMPELCARKLAASVAGRLHIVEDYFRGNLKHNGVSISFKDRLRS